MAHSGKKTKKEEEKEEEEEEEACYQPEGLTFLHLVNDGLIAHRKVDDGDDNDDDDQEQRERQ